MHARLLVELTSPPEPTPESIVPHERPRLRIVPQPSPNPECECQDVERCPVHHGYDD